MKAIGELRDFYGKSDESSREWARHADDVCFAYDVDNDSIRIRLKKIRIKLQDKAAEWFHDHSDLFSTWQEFVLTSIVRFPPPLTSIQAHFELKNVKQRENESTVDYYHRVLDLCEKVDPQMTRQAQIIHLFGGLRQNLQTLLSTQNIQTTAHFMAQIMNLETAERKILVQNYVVPQYPSSECVYENQFITAFISNQPPRLV
ncbi:unnamed protein product [Didymodactylos carnosus]|uniref:Retrotransposon gag domain-containing protein n=1 Tax=Didymodactylos carnosus TaxID=1234261 RepID=A0A8S2QZX2_9BILA|nr:unnamed protein product [Didymodactylos carnosus]CAF4134862.1 unnamed protein product [Didymodactylos carnosus]